jgi:hypothetical protein
MKKKQKYQIKQSQCSQWDDETDSTLWPITFYYYKAPKRNCITNPTVKSALQILKKSMTMMLTLTSPPSSSRLISRNFTPSTLHGSIINLVIQITIIVTVTIYMTLSLSSPSSASFFMVDGFYPAVIIKTATTTASGRRHRHRHRHRHFRREGEETTEDPWSLLSLSLSSSSNGNEKDDNTKNNNKKDNIIIHQRIRQEDSQWYKEYVSEILGDEYCDERWPKSKIKIVPQKSQSQSLLQSLESELSASQQQSVQQPSITSEITIDDSTKKNKTTSTISSSSQSSPSLIVEENDDDSNDLSSDDVDVDVDVDVDDVVDDLLKQVFSLSEDEDGSNIDDNSENEKDESLSTTPSTTIGLESPQIIIEQSNGTNNDDGKEDEIDVDDNHNDNDNDSSASVGIDDDDENDNEEELDPATDNKKEVQMILGEEPSLVATASSSQDDDENDDDDNDIIMTLPTTSTSTNNDDDDDNSEYTAESITNNDENVDDNKKKGTIVVVDSDNNSSEKNQKENNVDVPTSTSSVGDENNNNDLRAVVYRNITGNAMTYIPLANLTELGYTVPELKRIQAEILSIIVLDKRKNPKIGGVPVQWKINDPKKSSEISIVNSTEEASKIVNRMNDEEWKERNSIADRRRRQQERRRTGSSSSATTSSDDERQGESRTANKSIDKNKRGRPLEETRKRSSYDNDDNDASSRRSRRDRRQKRSNDDDDFDTPTKVRRNNSKGRRIYSVPRSDRGGVSRDDPPDPNSPIWVDIETFRGLMRKEAEFRMQFMGDDWAPTIKQENNWRTELYKNWLWALNNGVGESIVPPSRYERARRNNKSSIKRKRTMPRKQQEEEPRRRRRKASSPPEESQRQRRRQSSSQSSPQGRGEERSQSRQRQRDPNLLVDESDGNNKEMPPSQRRSSRRTERSSRGPPAGD